MFDLKISPGAADQLEQLMQPGYAFLQKKQAAAACRSWQAAWEFISCLLSEFPGASVEAIDQALHGVHSIASWSADFETALVGAGQEDPGFYRIFIDFSREYLSRSENPGSLPHLNRRRLMADSLFKIGSPDEGEAAFSELTRQYPGYAWGWISWAKQYSFSARNPWHSQEKAEHILRNALKSPVQENRRDIADALRDILVQQGRPVEASLIFTR